MSGQIRRGSGGAVSIDQQKRDRRCVCKISGERPGFPSKVLLDFPVKPKPSGDTTRRNLGAGWRYRHCEQTPWYSGLLRQVPEERLRGYPSYERISILTNRNKTGSGNEGAYIGNIRVMRSSTRNSTIIWTSIISRMSSAQGDGSHEEPCLGEKKTLVACLGVE